MRPRPKDLAGSCACSPFDAIIARIEALEQRAAAIVSSVEGIPPDGTGNVNLPNSSEIGDALYGRMDAFTMSSVAKAINDELNALLTRIGGFDFAGTDGRITAATEAIEQIEAELESYEARISAVEDDIISINAHILAVENDYVQKVGDTMTGPLHIPTNATGTRNDVAVNGNRVQADLDAYSSMMRTVNNQVIYNQKDFAGTLKSSGIFNNKTVVVKTSPSVGSLWIRAYYTTVREANFNASFLVNGQKGNNRTCSGIISMTSSATIWLDGIGLFSDAYKNRVVGVIPVTGGQEIWVYCGNENEGISLIRLSEYSWGEETNKFIVDGVTSQETLDPTDTTLYSSYSYIR